MTPELEALTQRLEEVEKQIAHLTSLIAEQSDANRTVVAQRFVVKDKQGVRRAELGMPPGEPELGPWLGLLDANGNVRACVGVGGDSGDGSVSEGPWVELYNEKNKAVVEIRVDANGPQMRMFDANGKTRISLTVGSRFSQVVLTGEDDTESFLSFGFFHPSQPGLFMNDASGKSHLTLVLDTDGPHLAFSKEDKVIWSAP